MGTTLDVIKLALGHCRVIPAGATPKARDQVDCMVRLNNLFEHLEAYGAAAEYNDAVATAAETISRDEPSARRQCDTSGGAFTITLPEDPRDGARFSVIDVAQTFNTKNLTIDSDGQRFDAVLTSAGNLSGGSTTTTALAIAGLRRFWMYRADLGAWIRRGTTLTLSDFMPYPVGFDQSFGYMLAVLISGDYGVELTREQLAHAQTGYSRLSARYVEPMPGRIDPALRQRRRSIFA